MDAVHTEGQYAYLCGYGGYATTTLKLAQAKQPGDRAAIPLGAQSVPRRWSGGPKALERRVMAPDFKPVVWDEESRSTGVYWGAALPDSFLNVATPDLPADPDELNPDTPTIDPR